MPKRDFILLYAYNAVLVGLPWPLSKQRSCVCNIDLWGILQEMNEQHCSQQEILNWGTSQILWDCYWATCEGTGWPGHRLLPKLKVVPISTIQVLAHQGKQRDLCSVPANRTTWGPQTQPFQFSADAGSSFSMQSYHLPLLLNPDLTGWLSPLLSGPEPGLCPTMRAAGHRAMPAALCPLPGPSSTIRLEPRDDTSGKLLAPSRVQNTPQGIICRTAMASVQLQNYWRG